MPANALLVRWVGGWLEVANPAVIASYGRREAFLDLSAQQSQFEAQRLALAQLDAVAGVRTETSVDVAPVGATDAPFIAYGTGDYVNVPSWDGVALATRVIALGGAVDDNGQLSFSVDLSDQVY